MSKSKTPLSLSKKTQIVNTYRFLWYNISMYIAIDIGGTKTLIALFSNHGRCLKRQKFLTPTSEQKFSTLLTDYLTPFVNKKINHVVVAVPGIVQKDYSVSPPNIPTWHNFCIQPIIKKLFTCPVTIMNDADLATLYEAKNLKGSSIYLTFSTGIGAGLAKNGKLSKTSSTLEPGHTIYRFGEKDLEWEDLASAHAINQLFNVSSIRELTDPSDLDAVAFRLSLGLNDLIKSLHPNHIIIGGPLAYILPRLYPYLLEYLLPDKQTSHISIHAARRPEESVIYGCYLHASSL